jgi:branched-chain amino acid transport system permease protein
MSGGAGRGRTGRWRAVPLPGIAAAVLLVLLVGAAVPALSSAYWLKIFTLSTVYALAAAGAGVLYGRLGFVSLNQVALLGVGGWVFLRLGHQVDLPNPVLLLVAGLVTCAVGVFIGLPSLRLSGLNLALVTLMAAGAFEIVFGYTGFPDSATGWQGRAGEGEAVTTVARPAFAASDRAMFRYVLLVTALMFALLWLFLRGRAGRAWAAIRQSEAGAYAAGVAVTPFRLLALALVSFTAGVAGGLLASGDGRLDAVSFPAQQSIVLFAVVLIGGAYSLLGAVFAGLLSQALPALVDSLGLNDNLILVVFGAGLLHALVTAPRGIAGQVLAAVDAARGRFGGPRRRPDPPVRTGQSADDAVGTEAVGA